MPRKHVTHNKLTELAESRPSSFFGYMKGWKRLWQIKHYLFWNNTKNMDKNV